MDAETGALFEQKWRQLRADIAEARKELTRCIDAAAARSSDRRGTDQADALTAELRKDRFERIDRRFDELANGIAALRQQLEAARRTDDSLALRVQDLEYRVDDAAMRIERLDRQRRQQAMP